MLRLQEAAEVRSQMAMQPGVVVEPPEGRCREDNEVSSTPAESFQFVDARVVVWRWSCVISVFLKEGKREAIGERTTYLLVIDEDKSFSWRDEGNHLVRDPPKLLPPFKGLPRLLPNSGFQSSNPFT